MPEDKLPQDIKFSEYVQARTYAGHCSFVNQIEYSATNNIAFTTGVSDEAIF